ncbi:MAG: hypothetical protein KDA50_12310 [Rhodobacteraceae bacterium]|nr:hypothetical protein [Paracoccaceae bacterium]
MNRIVQLPASLPRTPDRPVSLDWAALRAEGIDHIRALSGQIWTDHNAHDPGITALEVLCYALTDLSYRAGFPVADLLTGPDGRIAPPDQSGLFPAHEVLPTAPRTLADYRRLLMKVDGVRNAWLNPMMEVFDPAHKPAAGDPPRAEVPLYHDAKLGRLSDQPVGAGGAALPQLPLSGLYRVLVDLEDDDRLGPLNDTAAEWPVTRGGLRGRLLRIDCLDPDLDADTVDPALHLTDVAVGAVTAIPLGYRAELTLSFADGSTRTLAPWLVTLDPDEPRPGPAGIAALLDLASGPVQLFWARLQARAAVLARVRAVLHAHRGLCEDYLSIAAIAAFRVGICCDIDVTPGADLEEVQARVFRAIEDYLSPPVRFRPLADLLADGVPVDAIFDGPQPDPAFSFAGAPVFTKPGFLTDAALSACDLRRQVQASDLINLIMDIDGISGLRNLVLRAYGPDGVALGDSQPWTLDVPAGHRPVFFGAGSKLLFFKQGLPFRAQTGEFAQTLQALRLADRAAGFVPSDQALSLPAGRWRDPGRAYSVQEDFPETYGIGKVGLPRNAAPGRLAQARQFKAYLAVFDQVLADYLGQIAGLRQLYGLDPALVQAAFPQFLSDAPGTLGDYADEFYVDPAALADDTTRLRLTETEPQSLDRRTRVLDHLIARFAERFTDYALTRVAAPGDRFAQAEGLIADRVAFLKDYPALSRDRGQGANIVPEDPALIWDSANVSGLERRLSRLLGLAAPRRGDLHCAGHQAAFTQIRQVAGRFYVSFRDIARKQVFRSREDFDTRAAAQDASDAIYDALRTRDISHTEAPGGTGSWQLSLSAGGVTLTEQRDFDGQDDAVAAARAVIDAYDAHLHNAPCDSEGMHLIEHILLRPRAPGQRLMSLCDGACTCCGDADPYSFRAALVLPYWPARFRDPAFRALLERTAREECPAHVQLRICWIGQAAMERLDAAHAAWLQALATGDADLIGARAGDVIDVLERLRSVYPPARLHDCDDGGDAGAIRLGHSALGLF